MRITLFLLLILLPVSLAHDWQELSSPELSQQDLENLLTLAETLQTNLPNDLPVLAKEAMAKDWLTWLNEGLMLDTREGQTALANRLAEIGFSAPEDDLVLYWQHQMEHLVFVQDALSVGTVDQEALEAQLEVLPEDNYQEAERLHYLVSLVMVSDSEKQNLAPMSQRLTGLINQAKGVRS